MYEVNGNLIGEHGFTQDEYNIFLKSINIVWKEYIDLFGSETLLRYPLFIDNAIDGSGYTPITIPVLNQFIIIKLNICGNRDFNVNEIYNSRTIYQFSHELGHFFFYCMAGIKKSLANSNEECLCTAISFCILNKHCRDVISYFLSNCKNTRYVAGAKLAEDINFNMFTIVDMMKRK